MSDGINPQEILDSLLVEDAQAEVTETTDVEAVEPTEVENTDEVKTEETTETQPEEKQPELDSEFQTFVEELATDEVTPEKIQTEEEQLKNELEKLLQSPAVKTNNPYVGADGKSIAIHIGDQLLNFDNETEVRKELFNRQQAGHFEDALLIEKNYKQYLENKNTINTANSKYLEIENKEWAIKATKWKTLLKEGLGHELTVREENEINDYILNAVNKGDYNPAAKESLIKEAIRKTSLGSVLKQKALSVKAGPKAQVSTPDSKVKPKSVGSMDGVDYESLRKKETWSDDDVKSGLDHLKSLLPK